MHKPGVIEIMKKTGMKKYNNVKSNIGIVYFRAY
tara:strand:- start:95 stop:196 length:102 start_codon:yes stop_codon:yes gene_type:complete